MAMTTGGAPTSKEVFQFLERCFKIPVAEGYASTEGGSLFWMKGVKQGAIDKTVEIKLVSVPEMNYFVTDKPYPRGEMYIKSPNVFSGYYNNPDGLFLIFLREIIFFQKISSFFQPQIKHLPKMDSTKLEVFLSSF